MANSLEHNAVNLTSFVLALLADAVAQTNGTTTVSSRTLQYARSSALDLKEQLAKARKVVVVGAGTWGEGKTEAEALSNMKRYGGTSKQVIYYDAPYGAYVDGSGSLVWPGQCEELGIERPKEIRRVGFRK